jgi:hypothetical protein
MVNWYLMRVAQTIQWGTFQIVLGQLDIHKQKDVLPYIQNKLKMYQRYKYKS